MNQKETFRNYWCEYIKKSGVVTASELLDYTENQLGLHIDSSTRIGKLNSIRKSLDMLVSDGKLKKHRG